MYSSPGLNKGAGSPDTESLGIPTQPVRRAQANAASTPDARRMLSRLPLVEGDGAMEFDPGPSQVSECVDEPLTVDVHVAFAEGAGIGWHRNRWVARGYIQALGSRSKAAAITSSSLIKAASSSTVHSPS